MLILKKETWWKLRGDEDFKNLNSAKAWKLVGVAVAELMGTGILVGLGCGGVATHTALLDTVLNFASAITLAVTIFSHISGTHISPAISLAALLNGMMSLPMFLLYVISQCVGATIGIVVVKMLFPEECTATSFCVTQPNPAVGDLNATIAEAFLTGIVVLLVNAVWDPRCHDKQDSVAIKFTLGVIAIALSGAKFSGASLNPARSFGPALVSGNWSKQWIYWVGPMGGSIVASAIYRIFLSQPTPKKRAPR